MIFLKLLNCFIFSIFQLIMFPSPTFYGKIRDYFGLLDRIDILNNFLFFLAFIVRWKYIEEGKVIYCVNAIIFFMRVLRVYTANRTLGPKIYMINRMVNIKYIFTLSLLCDCLTHVRLSACLSACLSAFLSASLPVCFWAIL